MGRRLSKQAWESDEYFQVGANARLLLLRMAHVALDEDQKGKTGRWYFESRLKSARALGKVADAPSVDPDGDEQRNKAMLTVRRAVAELVAAGAIERRSAVDKEHRVHTGRQEEYFVLVGLSRAERKTYLARWSPVENRTELSEQRTGSAPLSGQKVHPSRPSGVHYSSATGVKFLYPQGTTPEEQGSEEQFEEPGSSHPRGAVDDDRLRNAS
ncbi:hypothetical protein F1C58_04775 [Glaciihabitans sp. INWT7]|uniref:hypothetical protein n=1 Tax=Glaciihabitans sp. INWT7 TaxID=2596912 RepID=UPI0016298EAA|nr:hypothetical protein [Glaciihabitans sp. INWT7]QNE46291.1 hypothetical protein F1C58_04775 [Glaciihabitans sp. INWT7]